MADMSVVLSTSPMNAQYGRRRVDRHGVVHAARIMSTNDGTKHWWAPPCMVTDRFGEYTTTAYPEVVASQVSSKTPLTCLLCLREVGW